MLQTRRCILGVFAHPDDETSCAGGTFSRYAHEGVDIYVAIATQGEQGSLGTGGRTVARQDLPAVRAAELGTVLRMYGAKPPIFLGYRDQEVAHADVSGLVTKIAAVMITVTPDVIITFGPTGLSGHPDHVAVHRATVAAFHQYRATAAIEPRLYYKALLAPVVKALGFTLAGPEVQPTVVVDISAYKALKVQALRTYTSQEDAQQLAEFFERSPWTVEAFHQAYPPTSAELLTDGFWAASASLESLSSTSVRRH